MATTSNASNALASKSVAFTKANDTEEREQLKKARKNQAAWTLSAAVLRLTKLCAPKCLDYDRI